MTNGISGPVLDADVSPTSRRAANLDQLADRQAEPVQPVGAAGGDTSYRSKVARTHLPQPVLGPSRVAATARTTVLFPNAPER